jgi:hypothetical protein
MSRGLAMIPSINPNAVIRQTSQAATRILEGHQYLTPKSMSRLQKVIKETPLWNCDLTRTDAAIAKRVFNNGVLQPVIEPQDPSGMLHYDDKASKVISDISEHVMTLISKYFPEIAARPQVEISPTIQRKFFSTGYPQEVIGHHRDGNNLATAIVDLTAPSKFKGGRFFVTPYDIYNEIPVDKAKDIVTPRTNGLRLFINQTPDIVNAHAVEHITIGSGKKPPEGIDPDKVLRTIMTLNVRDPHLT